jgi:hypothetical protein
VPDPVYRRVVVEKGEKSVYPRSTYLNKWRSYWCVMIQHSVRVKNKCPVVPLDEILLLITGPLCGADAILKMKI